VKASIEDTIKVHKAKIDGAYASYLGALPNTTPDTRNPKQDIIGLKAKADVIQ
jgi:hypothetical protein